MTPRGGSGSVSGPAALAMTLALFTLLAAAHPLRPPLAGALWHLAVDELDCGMQGAW